MMPIFSILWLLLNNLYFFLEIFLVLAYIKLFRIKAERWRVIVLALAVLVIKFSMLFLLQLLPVSLFTNIYSGTLAWVLLTSLCISLLSRYLLPLSWRKATFLWAWLLLIGLAVTFTLGAVNNYIAPQGGVVLNVSFSLNWMLA